MITGERVGDYVGELNVEKLSPGQYRITGPRGSCVMTKTRERVLMRAWTRPRTRTMTVWNPSECSVKLDTDAHGLRVLPLWALTLRQAIDNLVPVLCTYRSRR